MKRALVVAVTCLAGALAAAQAPAPAAAPATVGARTWIGRQAQIEESLLNAPIERSADLPVGVTKSSRVFFGSGSPAASATVKDLPMGRRGQGGSHRRR